MNPDQAHCFVRPDLGKNSLQRLQADDKKSLARKEITHKVRHHIEFAEDNIFNSIASLN